MTDEPKISEQEKIQFVDSLLHSLYKNDRQHAQSLVSAGLDRLTKATPNSDVLKKHTAKGARLINWQLVGWASAATVLLALAISLFNSPQSALASVRQSIQQSLVNVGRHYKVTSKVQTGERGTVERHADLYVKGGERFAIHASGPLGGPGVWLIGNREDAWVVPPIGPVIEGDKSDLDGWLSRRDDLATPYLHVSTILERMRTSYDLESRPKANLKTDLGVVACQHVVGILRDPTDGRIPSRIELWADSKSGVALKVVGEWELEVGEVGRQSICIEFQEEVDLANEFFGPEYHGGTRRRYIRF